MTSTTPEKTSRRQQFVDTYKMAKVADPRLGLWVLLAFLGRRRRRRAVLFWVLPPDGGIFEIVSMVVGAILVRHDDRRCSSSAGARRSPRSPRWRAAPVPPRPPSACSAAGGPPRPPSRSPSSRTSCTAWSDRPGIVLVGEGNPARLRSQLTAERRKYERVTSETPVTEVLVGDGEGQVPLPKLVKHVTKLPKALKPADMTDVLNRIKAIDANRPSSRCPRARCRRA